MTAAIYTSLSTPSPWYTRGKLYMVHVYIYFCGNVQVYSSENDWVLVILLFAAGAAAERCQHIFKFVELKQALSYIQYTTTITTTMQTLVITYELQPPPHQLHPQAPTHIPPPQIQYKVIKPMEFYQVTWKQGDSQQLKFATHTPMSRNTSHNV